MNSTKDYNYNSWDNNNCINFNIYVNKVQATEIENNNGTGHRSLQKRKLRNLINIEVACRENKKVTCSLLNSYIFKSHDILGESTKG